MRTGYVAVGLAAVLTAVPALHARDSRASDDGKATGTAIQAEQRQTHQSLRSNTGISLAVPTGRVWAGPALVEGEPIHVRRMTVREGMTIVEVSTAPFEPVLSSNEVPSGGGQSIARSDQPAPW